MSGEPHCILKSTSINKASPQCRSCAISSPNPCGVHQFSYHPPSVQV